MFCPNCGRENKREQKFCVACGTNLDVVSQALAGRTTNFFTRIDLALDQFIARYAEHVFEDAPAKATERKLSNSWKLLGQGVLTSFVDIFLSTLMWNVFSLKFNFLLIATPFRLISERRSRRQRAAQEPEPPTLPMPSEAKPAELPPVAAPSITENTTDRLPESLSRPQARKENSEP